MTFIYPSCIVFIPSAMVSTIITSIRQKTASYQLCLEKGVDIMTQGVSKEKNTKADVKKRAEARKVAATAKPKLEISNGKRFKTDSRPLAERLIQVMDSKSHTRHDLASIFGLSYIHLTSLINGIREFSGLGIDKQRKIADYMGISFAQFYIYMGVLQPADFFIKETFSDRMNMVFERMAKDPTWSSSVPPIDELIALPTSVKLLIALMYEQLCKECLLEKMDVVRTSDKK